MIRDWISNNTLAAGLIFMAVVGGCNYVTTGDIDGKPHETCIDNPRNNDQQCWPDDGYTYNDDGDVVRIN